MSFHSSDITADMAEQAELAAAEPEGMSFYVLTDSHLIARQVAPMLASKLHPDMHFGRVLHSELTSYDGDAIEVVLKVEQS